MATRTRPPSSTRTGRSSSTATRRCSRTCLPASSHGRRFFPYWDDLYTLNSGYGIYTTTTGSAPNRTFYIEWRAQYFPGSGNANFEAAFNESDLNLKTIYGRRRTPGARRPRVSRTRAAGSSPSTGCDGGAGRSPTVWPRHDTWTGAHLRRHRLRAHHHRRRLHRRHRHLRHRTGSTTSTTTSDELSSNSQNFEASLNHTTTSPPRLRVPTGDTWNVRRASTSQGEYFNGPGPAISANVHFYPNGGGNLPGTLLESRPNRNFTNGPSFVLDLSSPGILARAPTGSRSKRTRRSRLHGQWGWNNRTVQAYAAAAGRTRATASAQAARPGRDG